jgi:hypothetical protein
MGLFPVAHLLKLFHGLLTVSSAALRARAISRLTIDRYHAPRVLLAYIDQTTGELTGGPSA